MRKRVGLARALIDRPEVLLYDEPTTGLDPMATKNVDDMIRRHSRRLRRHLRGDLARHGVDLPHRRPGLDAVRWQDARHRHAGRVAGSNPHPYLREFIDTAGTLPPPPGGERPMRRSWASVTVGALALVVWRSSYLLFMYTSEGNVRDGYQVYAYFTDALGLFDKSGVRSAGIDIGKIESKAFDPETGQGQDRSADQPGHHAVRQRRRLEAVGVAAGRVLPGRSIPARRTTPSAAPPGRPRCWGTAIGSNTSTNRPTSARSSTR